MTLAIAHAVDELQGLRALRVAVALENPGILQRVGLDPDQR